MIDLHFYHIKKFLPVIGFLIVTGCVSSTPSGNNNSGPTRITKIDYRSDEIIVHINRSFSGGTPMLTYVRGEQVSSKSAKFKISTNSNKSCYGFFIERKGSSPSWPSTRQFYSPQGETSENDWCFENTSLTEYRELIERERTLEKELSRSTYEYGSLERRDNGYSDECKKPKPIVVPEPAPFCANQSIVEAKRDSCFDPGVKRLCKFGANQIFNQQNDKNTSAKLSVACLGAIDQFNKRPTTLVDVFIAGGTSRILSELGGVGKGLSYGIPAAKVFICLSRLRSACYPSAPRPPDCSRWLAHKAERDSRGTKNSNMTSELEDIKSKISILKNEYQTANYWTKR